MKYANVPIFIPHLACPNDCVFCNQRKIAATLKAPEPYEIEQILEDSLKTVDFGTTDCDIAFFGGSFTGIPVELMTEYLRIASRYVRDGAFSGIRCSTRPDYINRKILDILKRYKVKTIELGAQSMNDNVLKESGRGHTAQDTINASALIKEYGFELILQMMTGLPGDTPEGTKESVRKIIALEPDGVRIYPTLVIKDTCLEKMYYNGLYKPQALSEAVDLCSELLLMFYENNIPVIRLGLFAGDGLSDGTQIAAGPFHPAFKELCENRIFYNKAREALKQKENLPESICIAVPKGAVSKMIGQKKENINKLKNEFKLKNIKIIEDNRLTGFEVSI